MNEKKGNQAPESKVCDGAEACRAEEVSLLVRRGIEAGIVKPLLEAFSMQFGRDRVRELADEVIRSIAREQGDKLARQYGSRSLTSFLRCVEMWKSGGALEIQMLEQSDERLSINVTRCRFAEVYAEMGLGDLGVVLSCNRDFALIEGFNPRIALERKHTIMEGAPYCDLRFSLR
ncbi:L-2-amino-thiazoline-4-carboxylic acid hydrolase [Thermodesulfobacteriota bacterium]